jgi:prepilin-type N-terminal cleavage/methylation domain-containing protein
MKRTRNAFTLIEMLIVIAIISILAAMAISSFSNAAQDSREVLVRQQLAVVQQAVNNWAARQIGKVATNGGKPQSIEQIRTVYNTPSTASGRLLLFQGYLDDGTTVGLSADDTTGFLTTDAMRQTGYYLTLPSWTSGSYPKVQINP